MLPSSSRVKLNRVALQTVAELKAAPRRRRPLNTFTADPPKQEENSATEPEKDPGSDPGSNEPVRTILTHQTGPETRNAWPGNIPKGQPGTQRAKRGKHLQPRSKGAELKPEGPNTRGKYRRSKPNTRSKSRLECLRTPCNLGLRFTWCVCSSDSDRLLFRRNLGGKMSCHMTAKSHAQGGLKCATGPAFRSGIGRSRVVREGRGSVTAKSVACDPQPAAHSGPERASTAPSTPANFEKISVGLAGSEVCLRRAVGASHCDHCWEGKYPSSQQKTLYKQGAKSSSPGSQPPTAECKILKENTVTDTSKKIVIWINQYPKVTLCDVAKSCDACSHNCGYVLADILKTKVVHCFKQDMRPGFRFLPGCLERNKHESDERAAIKNRECCPSVQPDRSICPSIAESQKHPEEGSDLPTLSNHTTCRLYKSWTSEDSTSCFASFLQSKHKNRRECRAGIRDSDAKDYHGPGSDLIGSEIRRDKRIKQDGLGHSSTFSSTGKENWVTKKLGNWRDDLTKIDGTEMSSGQMNDVITDEPESFTCQRVRVYSRKTHFSCARVYMPWPFVNRSLTFRARDATTACSAGSVDPSAGENSDCEKANQTQPGSPSNHIKDTLPNAPTETQKEDNDRYNTTVTSHSDRKSMEMTVHLMQAKESAARLPPPLFSTSTQHGKEPGTDTVSASSLLVRQETDNSESTPSPAAPCLSDSETAPTLSPMSSPIAQVSSSSLSATPSSLLPSSFQLRTTEKVVFQCEETQLTSCSPMSSVPPHYSDSFRSCDSSLLLAQEDYESDEEMLTDRSPPKLQPYYKTSTFMDECAESSFLCSIPNEHCVKSGSYEFMLPPMLSPVTSPNRQTWNFSRQSSSLSDEEEEKERNTRQNQTLHPSHVPQIVSSNNGNIKDYFEHGIEELEGRSGFKGPTNRTPREPLSSSSSDEDVDNNKEEESLDEADYEDNAEQGNRSSQVPVDPNIKTSHTSGVLTEPRSSPSSNKDDDAAFSDEGPANRSNITGSKGVTIKAEAAGDSQPSILDEFTAYEQDILLVDVIQDDPELFDNLPALSQLKLGPARVTEAPKNKPNARVKMPSSRTNEAPVEFAQRWTPVTTNFDCDSPDTTDKSNSRSWRPQSRATPTEMQNNKCPVPDNQTINVADANNNHVNGGQERSQPIQTVSSTHNIPQLMSVGAGLWITNSANMTDYRRQKSNAYCRQYFSESLSCGFKMCRFQHLPVEGDEKFCVEIVARFTKKPACLQKAGAVFTGYYQNNPPGVYFSLPVLLTLLWALLKAGMVSDVFLVLNVSLAHSIVPGYEFLLALFDFVREKGHMGFASELMQLTFKMASAGLELSLDCLDYVKNAPVSQQMIDPNAPVSVSGSHKLTTSAPSPEYLNLAHAIVEIEFCIKQEDWRRVGEVFKSICQASHHPNQVERISGHVAIALLSESKDKLSLPFAAFAETACQNEGEDSMTGSFVGRIGVSLMLRYYKTHQWAKGCRVVERLSFSKVNYSTLKSLFGNEDGASRCYLITVATELFLLSGSVEGALTTLRENKWFLSSCQWPCQPADLETRIHVLIRLTEKTSHRDTLEVLCNLPGIKESNDMMAISRYTLLFSSHLEVCVNRQILPVASDTVDFMFSNNLLVNPVVLQTLLNKLGKQNLWLRAREVFKHSLNVGYYPGVSAPSGFMTLIVPCQLREVEFALTFEMFITVNAPTILHLSEPSTSTLSITLKRTQNCESEYLAAGSRLLSAACTPQPKLIVHYTTVNASQEQVFTLDVSSARRWLHHNHSWASEMWAH